MPMYEKGSVRAEPRSKQQERMKKIMKKFLSSLLALTMILSLVIVPANATDQALADGYTLNGSFSVTADKESVANGETVNLTAVNITATKTSAEPQPTFTYTYTWGSGATVTQADTKTATATPTTTNAAGETKTYSCTLVIMDTTNSTKVLEKTESVSVRVTNAQAAFESRITKVNVEGRTYNINKSTSSWSAPVQYFSTNAPAESAYTVDDANVTVTLSSDGKTLTVTDKTDTTLTKNITINPTKPSDVSLTMKADGTSVANNGTVEAVVNQNVALAVTYGNAASSNAKYYWEVDGNAVNGTGKTTYTFSNKTIKVHDVTCTVKEGSSTVATIAIKVDVKADHYQAEKDSRDKLLYNLVQGDSKTLHNPTLMNTATTPNSPVSVSSDNIEWSSDNASVAAVTKNSNGSGETVTAGEKSGTANITAKITFNNNEYKVTYKFVVTALDVELDPIANGDYENYDSDDFAAILADKINKVVYATRSDSFKASDVSSATVISSDSYIKFTRGSSSSEITDLTQDFRISATRGYLGDQTFKVRVNGTYVVTLTVNVEGAGSTIKDTVSGTAANKDVTFTNSDYKYLYYTTSKVTDYEGYFNGKDVRGWSEADKNKTVTVKASEFNSNKTVTLYVVGVDSDGYASTGTITVSQKSYDINYNVVAGKTVTFSQKDFEDFMKDYAQDNDDWTTSSRQDYPYVDFDYITLSSIPTAKSEGTLYYGGSEVTSTTNRKAEYTDMDKMTFEAVSKPSKDTVTLRFTVVGKKYTRSNDKGTKVFYPVDVVISVVKEDLTYTVGIDDTVQLTARDFVNFLQDARTSYRKAELDYVKFDVSGKNVSSYAYGGLYRSYSSYSTGKLADSTDKFYYEPSRTQYDLADVAYHTTRWAEAGKTVYIPFTVYGTKGEEASGTMAITIAQTMNFIDVKASDFFYEPVKWAVSNKITNGTSSTTFSPYKNCNRAEIVTFLWRAAGTPEPTSTRNPFTDVNSVRDASYYKAILWASQKGITAGTNATTFSPYQECTRSQIVTFLYRYAGKPSGYYSNPFKDVSSVNEASYYNAILWAVGKGITQGTSTTTFSPYASCTRGEAVTFLYRYVNGVK